MPTKTSYITRIFDRLVNESRARGGRIRRAPLAGGAELVVRVADGTITLTIKRRNQPLGAVELLTFKRDCCVPEDAELLTPAEQGTRYIDVEVRDGRTVQIEQQTWRYVTWRWKDDR